MATDRTVRRSRVNTHHNRRSMIVFALFNALVWLLIAVALVYLVSVALNA